MKELTKVQIQRRAKLQVLLDQHGSTTELAHALGFASPSRVSHLLRTKGMGERAAREIETRLKLPPGWMDVSGEVPPDMPNVDWLVAIYLALSKNHKTRQLSEKKLSTVVWSAYASALKSGTVDAEEVNRLIALGT